MEERTEEQKIVQEPITVTLGGKEYKICLLVIRESRAWRKQLIGVFDKLSAYLKGNTEDTEGFNQALNAMLVETPDAVADLFFAYAKDLDRDGIEATATDVELSTAFQEVMKAAFPLLQTVLKALGKMHQ